MISSGIKYKICIAISTSITTFIISLFNGDIKTLWAISVFMPLVGCLAFLRKKARESKYTEQVLFGGAVAVYIIEIYRTGIDIGLISIIAVTFVAVHIYGIYETSKYRTDEEIKKFMKSTYRGRPSEFPNVSVDVYRKCAVINTIALLLTLPLSISYIFIWGDLARLLGGFVCVLLPVFATVPITLPMRVKSSRAFYDKVMDDLEEQEKLEEQGIFSKKDKQ